MANLPRIRLHPKWHMADELVRFRGCLCYFDRVGFAIFSEHHYQCAACLGYVRSFVISLKCPCAALLYGLCYPTETALESAQATLAICCLTVRYGCKQYLIGRLGAYMYIYDWLCRLTTNKKSS